ncbi:unnamed protein product, partial [Bubo scandiacus]
KPLAFLATWAHCWLMFSQPSINTPRSLSDWQLSSHSSPSLKVSLEPSLLQAEQPQLSHPFFIGELFQPSDNFCGPILDLLYQIHVLLMLGAPELNTILQ